MSAAIKPEIYATWIPRGNIAVKPEIYVTVYRAPQLVRITGDTTRTLKKIETASADSFRQIGTSAEVIGDTCRIVGQHVTLNGDTLREVDDLLPDFGLIVKEDKRKLEWLYANAIVAGEMTADGFVLKNMLGESVMTIPAGQP